MTTTPHTASASGAANTSEAQRCAEWLTHVANGGDPGSEGQLNSLLLSAAAELSRLATLAAAPAQPTEALDNDPTSKAQYRRMFNCACAALGEISETLSLDTIEGGAEPIIAAIEDLKALTTRSAILDGAWVERLLDGRPIVRDDMGCGEHPELPVLEEGMRPRAFFAALGIELTSCMAEDELDMDAYDAMSESQSYNAWTPKSPNGDSWSLVAIFDSEDGPAAWWVRPSESTPAPLAAPYQPEPASEPMLRFCPGCGSVGPVPTKFRDCCPDGNESRAIPASLARKCHGLFQLALTSTTQEVGNT